MIVLGGWLNTRHSNPRFQCTRVEENIQNQKSSNEAASSCISLLYSWRNCFPASWGDNTRQGRWSRLRWSGSWPWSSPRVTRRFDSHAFLPKDIVQHARSSTTGLFFVWFWRSSRFSAWWCSWVWYWYDFRGPSSPANGMLSLTSQCQCSRYQYTTQVTSTILRACRLINIDKTAGGVKREVTKDVYWTIPDGVNVTSDNVIAKSEPPEAVSAFLPLMDPDAWLGDLISYKSGIEAATALRTGGSAAAHSFMISGDTSVYPALSRAFKVECQYGFFNYRHILLETHLTDYMSQILMNNDIRNLLKRLPAFKDNDPAVVRSYGDIFKLLGSHVITGAHYGGSFYLVGQVKSVYFPWALHFWHALALCWNWRMFGQPDLHHGQILSLDLMLMPLSAVSQIAVVIMQFWRNPRN